MLVVVKQENQVEVKVEVVVDTLRGQYLSLLDLQLMFMLAEHHQVV